MQVMICAAVVAAAGCATMGKPPIAPVAHVDIPRYMGRWYVIASIPTFVEKQAYNAVEAYELNADGTVATTFTFHKGSFDGPFKTLHPTGFVEGPGNAVWGMRLVWPFKSDYRIAYLSKDYSEVIVARNARDYVWIMARKPAIPEAEYQRLAASVAAMGYDTAKLRKVPQRWP